MFWIIIERVQKTILISQIGLLLLRPRLLLFIFATIAVMLTYGGVRVIAQYIFLWEPWFFLIYTSFKLNPISNIANFVTLFILGAGSSVALENLLAVPN